MIFQHNQLTRILLLSFGSFVLSGCSSDNANDQSVKSYDTVTLVKRAVLPADTFSAGTTSGTGLGKTQINGQTVPFQLKQPVQGFSSMIRQSDGTYLAMADNGFGTLENSADFELRVYQLDPDFETHQTINEQHAFTLSDPNKKIPFAITNQFSENRVLTGADFDIESMQRAPDGTFWFGDEFGPFLLHTDTQGVLLEAPISLQVNGKLLRTALHPDFEEGATVRVMNAFSQVDDSSQVQNPPTVRPVFSPWHVHLILEDCMDTAGKLNNKPGCLTQPYSRGNKTPQGYQYAPEEIFDLKSIQNAGYPVVTWTVNDSKRMKRLIEAGVDGVISDRPDLLLGEIRGNEAIAKRLLTEDGLIDPNLFDAQGHRGARNLKPENTLPAFEVALDYLMNTLETDTGITRDGQVVLSHDPVIHQKFCQFVGAGETPEEPLIKSLTLAEIQGNYVCNKLTRGASQTDSIPPVTEAFVRDKGLNHAYMMPSLDNLYDFVDFYITYYTTGAGRGMSDAEVRAKNASRVRFNLETKRNPRQDYVHKTVDPETFAKTVAAKVMSRQKENKTTIQSFDFSTLLVTQKQYPQIRTVYLFGDFPSAVQDDGTNLEPEAGTSSPWMPNVKWPWRDTRYKVQPEVQISGGFEGVAMSHDGKYLYPALEKPFISQKDSGLVSIYEFDIEQKAYTGKKFQYALSKPENRIAEFTLFNEMQGLIVERDNTQADLSGFKQVFHIELKEDGTVEKNLLVDLMKIADPNKVAKGETGDLGIGNGSFAMPYMTIESIAIVDKNHIAVMNDNNFPFSVGRHVGSGSPDDSEIVILSLPQPLPLKQ